MAKKWYNGSVSTMCPYYKGERNNCIICEGLIPGTTLTNRFINADAKKSFQEDECYGYPNSCSIALDHEQNNYQDHP